MTDDVRDLALPLRDAADLDPLLDRIGDARIVLLVQRYDAFLSFEDTTALRPLHLEPEGTVEHDTWPYAV